MTKPKVLVTDGIHPIAQSVLEGSCDVMFEPKLSELEIMERIAGMDALMVRSATQVSPSMFERAPQLKIVGRAGVGTDNIDLKSATRHGVIVVNSPGGNTIAAAEHTIGMLMALARHIPQADRIVKSGGWRTKELTGVELSGKVLGVIGFGKIGRRVANIFQRMGMQILVYDPFLSQQMAEELNVESASLETIFKAADFMTLHAPKTPETEHLLNAEAFSKMKTGVRIVNCARGGMIDEAALRDALASGKVAGAALDVFEEEPLKSDDFLLGFADKVITTPHLGASTEEAQVNVARDVAEQILEYFQSGIAQNAVNIPALRKEIMDPVRAYMPMAEQMGNLIRQITSGGTRQIELIACGTLSKENLMPLMLAVLKGLLGYAREGVNYVNALIVAEEEGISIKESRSPRAGNYLNLLTLNLITDTGTYSVSGSLLSDKLYRIVELNGYPANIEPTKYILLTPHIDKPGMIAKVATVLGDNHINVSTLEVARKAGTEAGGESMMVFNLDNPISPEVLKQIEGLDGIISAKFLALPD
jgi:D-3-phosphoglycerate dehydrogenase / 2-oxoglutarate reductase